MKSGGNRKGVDLNLRGGGADYWISENPPLSSLLTACSSAGQLLLTVTVGAAIPPLLPYMSSTVPDTGSWKRPIRAQNQQLTETLTNHSEWDKIQIILRCDWLQDDLHSKGRFMVLWRTRTRSYSWSRFSSRVLEFRKLSCSPGRNMTVYQQKLDQFYPNSSHRFSDFKPTVSSLCSVDQFNQIQVNQKASLRFSKF